MPFFRTVGRGACLQLFDPSNISPSQLGTPDNRRWVLRDDIGERGVFATVPSCI
jgi:hypothetical protein